MADITIQEYTKEFERLAAMPDETYFVDDIGVVYMNAFTDNVCGEDDEPTEEARKKYDALYEGEIGTLTGHTNELLILNGRPNWTNINYLERCGYRVYPTDQDSFGWLCAAVEKNNHIIIFG